jgi:hypothetical protein
VKVKIEETDSAFPSDYCPQLKHELGLTKREYFAAKAMQGFCSIPYTSSSDEADCAATDARRAVIAANALIEELAK